MKALLSKQLLSLAALITLTSAAWATQTPSQPLLTPTELQAQSQQPNVRVIDIRDPKSYQANHIAGSVNAPYGKWRGPAQNPGELPDLKKLTALVQGIGLTTETHAIIVSSGQDDTDFGAAARVYWTLKVLGLNQLSILNGGIKGWQKAGFKLDNTPVTVAASEFKPTIDTRYLISRDQLVQNVKNHNATLVDARPKAFFEGQTRHQAAKLPGTLEGAVNVEHSVWFTPGSNQVVSAEQAQSIAKQYNLVEPNQEVVSFCNTGHWAATNWFVLSELVGDKNVKLYAGSMVDWSQAPEALPMQNVPNRLKQLYIDAQLWFASL